MTVIGRDLGVIYEFNKENAFVKKVSPGSQVTIETYDCFKDQVQSADTVIESINWNEVNPATGPIFVEDALPGDILKVRIDNIEIGEQGILATGEGLGVMGDVLKGIETKILPIKDNKLHFNNIEIPLSKMIGVIGVAPEGEGVITGIPGPHGGNMDTTLVKEGATLYFPVFTEGALFALGDLHAAMGDGEVCGSGVEVAGEVTVTIDLLKGETIKQPMLENEDVFTQIASAERLDEAAKLASSLMIERIAEKTNLPLSEVTMLMSAVGQLEVGQVVNELKTARLSVPKQVIADLGIELLK